MALSLPRAVRRDRHRSSERHVASQFRGLSLIAFAVGAATGRHGLAVAIAASVAVAGYLLEGLLATSATMAWLRALSPWHWLLTRNVLVDNPKPLPLAALVVVGAVVVDVGGRRFLSRDLR